MNSLPSVKGKDFMQCNVTIKLIVHLKQDQEQSQYKWLFITQNGSLLSFCIAIVGTVSSKGSDHTSQLEMGFICEPFIHKTEKSYFIELWYHGTMISFDLSWVFRFAGFRTLMSGGFGFQNFAKIKWCRLLWKSRTKTKNLDTNILKPRKSETQINKNDILYDLDLLWTPNFTLEICCFIRSSIWILRSISNFQGHYYLIFSLWMLGVIWYSFTNY